MTFSRDFPPTSPRLTTSETMEVPRLVQAAAALSIVLNNKGIRHAFHGSVLPALLAKNSCSDVSVILVRMTKLLLIFDPYTQEIFCIVETGSNHTHPFRRVRDAVAGNDDFTVNHSTFTNRLVRSAFVHRVQFSHIPMFRLHVVYRRPIPAVEVSTHLIYHIT